MSGKKNRKAFSEEEDQNDMGFRTPEHRASDTPELETEKHDEEDADIKDKDDEEVDDEEDLEEHGYRMFDLDNPNEDF